MQIANRQSEKEDKIRLGYDDKIGDPNRNTLSQIGEALTGRPAKTALRFNIVNASRNHNNI